MLLRSSSAPLLGSLLSSSSSSSSAFADAISSRRLSFASPNTGPRLHFGIRRVRSEGNLSRRCALSVRSSSGSDDRGEERPEERSFDGLQISADRDAVGVDAPLFLARGLGIDGRIWPLGFLPSSGDGSGGYMGGGWGGGFGEERSDLGAFLKRMVEEHPCDALFLRNYAQFLYKTRKDAAKAEEYYSRAILAEPGDGETLAEYGKLILEHYRDRERASQYFNLAIQASPDDCFVLAAYAHFLWADDEEGGKDEQEAYSPGLVASSA